MSGVFDCSKLDTVERVLIDKPAGMTSFDVIRRLRKCYREQMGGKQAPKLGFAGTLDPAATGLLVLGVGRGTKQLGAYSACDKTYEAQILLGTSTTTGDQDGEVLETSPVSYTEAEVCEAVEGLVGEWLLPVSAYSAIKRDGVPMYKRARAAAARGELVHDVPVREMRVYQASCGWQSATNQSGMYQLMGEQIIVSATFVVAAGVYIRSLAVELGGRLDCPASLYSLRRTRVGVLSLNDAYRLPAAT